eukprot:jgi/Chlat1/1904/Chrsp147S08696
MEMMRKQREADIRTASSSLTRLVHILCQTGRPSQAAAVLQTMAEAGVEPTAQAYQTLARACPDDDEDLPKLFTRTNHISRGLELARAAQTGDAHALDMDATSSDGWHVGAELLADLREKVAVDDDDDVEDVVGIASGVRDRDDVGVSDTADRVDAIELARLMHSQREGAVQTTRPSEDADAVDELSAFMCSQIGLGLSEAQQLIADCTSKGTSVPSPALIKALHAHRVGTRTNVALYRIVLKACARAGEVDNAMQWLETMQREGVLPDPSVFETLMTLCAQSANLDLAKQFAKAIATEIITPTPTYFTLLNMCSKNNRMDLAAIVHRQMQQEGVRPLTTAHHTILIEYHGRSRNMEAAVAEFENLQSRVHRPLPPAFSVLIDAFGFCRDKEGVRWAWKRISQIGAVPNLNNHVSYMEALCRCGLIDEALVHFDALEHLGVRPDAKVYGTLIGFCLLNDMAPTGVELWHHCRRLDVELTGLLLDKAICLAHALKDVSLAREVREEMRNFGLTLRDMPCLRVRSISAFMEQASQLC